MANLPQELVERVCGFLSLEDLKHTVTVSPSFQYASERASGVYSSFDLTEENATEFLRLYSGRRWSYLRLVRFRAHAPPYDEDDEDENENEGEGSENDDSGWHNHRCRESQQELQEKNRIFTEQIHFVFETLRKIEDQFSSGRLQLTIFTPIREVHGCHHRKCISWRLRLLTPETLPQLTSVHALSLEDEKIVFPLEEDKSQLKVDLRVLIDLAAKLPNLEFLGCKLDAGSEWATELASPAARHYTRGWAGPLRDSRHHFAEALENVALPSTLRQAQLDFLYPLFAAERINQTIETPDLVSPATYDPFSSSLRLLSHRLRKLELKVVADPTLFWPSAGGASWPNLESICILFHITSPSGRWYFEGPLGDGRDTKGYEVTDEAYPSLEDTAEDQEWDFYTDDRGLDLERVTPRKFRVQPNDGVLVPFLTAFGKAACAMPALKEACLWAPLKWEADGLDHYEGYDSTQVTKYPFSSLSSLAWGITYVAPHTFGFHPFPGQHYSESRQLWWTTARWRPNEELRQLFQQIGDQSVELLEYWGHERYNPGLAERPIFERFEIFGYRHPNSPWRVQ